MNVRQAVVMVLGLLAGAAAIAEDAARMTGVWQVVGHAGQLQTIDGKEPPLLPAARQTYQQNRAAIKAGDRRLDLTNQCLPPGVPRLLFTQMPFELLPQRERVVFMYQWNRLARIADLDRPHSEPLGPTWLGQSISRWEGKALVVDTNAFNDRTFLDDAGMPHSDQLHVVERYTLDRSGNRLSATLRIEDPQTFAAPWEARVQFRRLRGAQIAEDVCVERLGLEQYK